MMGSFVNLVSDLVSHFAYIYLLSCSSYVYSLMIATVIIRVYKKVCSSFSFILVILVIW